MKKELTKKDFAFVSWTPEYIRETAKEAMAQKESSYAQVKSLKKEERNFQNTALLLDQSEGEYAQFFHFINLLLEVSENKEVREVVHEVLTDVSQKMVDLEYDPELFRSFKEYYEGNYKEEKKVLRAIDIKLVEESMREYRRAGFDKDAKTQKEIKKILKKIAVLSQEFSKTINDYTDYILCTEEELSGMSERYKGLLPLDEKTGKYMVTLAYPHLVPFLQESTNRDKRKLLAEKNLAKGGKKNLKRLEEIVELRAKLAELLGYKHHGDFRTETRMAKSAKNVEAFQKDILKKIAPLAKEDVSALREHAKKYGIKKLEHYDVSFVSTSLKKELYSYNPEALREFFPLPHVLSSLFALLTELYGITFKESRIKLWSKEVTLYEIRNEDSLGGGLVGYLALDLYSREGKFGHAACAGTIEPREVSYKSEEVTAPLAVIMCNFPSLQKKGKEVIPSLLSVGEVETLYHEVGHSMHHLLSKVALNTFSGMNTAWDFVETPSQYMENFVWNKKALEALSSHYKTGEPLDGSTIKNILASKKFQSGYVYTRQIVYGMLDMDIHTGKSKDPQAHYIALMKKYLGIEIPADVSLFPASFGHMMGYDAGYYSYLWALVYAHDVYSQFENAKDKRKVGLRFRNEVLAKGSEEDEYELLKKFLKREPSSDAFLKEIIEK